MSARYREILYDLSEVVLLVDFRTVRGVVVDYVVVVLLATSAGLETVRVYDGAHGYNEMHRYSRGGGKQSGTEFHSGTLGEGLRAAIGAVKENGEAMVEGWRQG